MGNVCLKTTVEILEQGEPEEYQEKEVIKSHTKKMSNHYTINYPEHDKRKNSTIYNKTHNELCHLRDLPCFICGKRNKDGIVTETHHFYIEKAAQNAIDWVRFSEFAKTCYNIQTGENIGEHFNWDEVEKNPDIFVDSTKNMIVLCKEHHISSSFGIHHVPFPEWFLQKFGKNNFKFLI